MESMSESVKVWLNVRDKKRLKLLKCWKLSINVVMKRACIKMKSEATCLVEYELNIFEFITSIVIWHHILCKVNNMSIQIQSKTVCMDETMSSVWQIIGFFKDYWDHSFEKTLIWAIVIASDIVKNMMFVEKISK